VVPSRIRKFATGMVDTTIGRIGGLPAMVDALDMEEVKTYFLEAATPMIAEAVHGLMREQQRVLWENLPAPTKKLVFQVVEMEMNDGIDALADDIHDHFERLLDLRELVVRKCEENPDLLKPSGWYRPWCGSSCPSGGCCPSSASWWAPSPTGSPSS
jgi:hypothetical protein